MSLIPEINISYELQDTIHTLREENAYLQHKLKNLTQALRDMRKLMLDHSHESAVDGDQLHAWNEWIQNGLNTETHLMLEQAFCVPDLHNSAVSLSKFIVFYQNTKEDILKNVGNQTTVALIDLHDFVSIQ